MKKIMMLLPILPLFFLAAVAPALADDFSRGLNAGFSEIVGSTKEESPLLHRVRTTEPIEKLPMKLMSVEFRAELSIVDGTMIALRSLDGRRLQLKNGPVILKYGPPALRSLVTGDRSLSVSQQNMSAVFPILNSRFHGFKNFVTEEENPHGIILRGRFEQKLRGSVKVKEQTSCTYSGYCYNCGPNFDGVSDCNFSLKPNCSGQKDVLVNKTKYERIYTVDFISVAERKILASMKSDPELFVQEKIVSEISSCR